MRRLLALKLCYRAMHIDQFYPVAVAKLNHEGHLVASWWMMANVHMV